MISFNTAITSRPINYISGINNDQSTLDYAQLFTEAKELIDSEDVETMKSTIEKFKELILTSTPNSQEKYTLGCYLGVMYHFTTKRNESLETLEKNLIGLNETSDIAYFTMHLGNVYRGLGNLEKSLELLSDSLAIYNTTP
jgi:hypothetical protein